VIDLDKLQALTDAAVPPPWRWAGNTDNDDPRIEGGPRRYYVMGVRRREREKDDRGTQDFERYMQEVEQFDPSLNDGKGGYRYLTEDEIAEAVRNDWLSEPNGEPRHDDRLSFINVDSKLMDYARDLAVYAVAPEATSRADERVYRADIVGVRNPNAELMIAAVNALPELIAEVRELREQVGVDTCSDYCVAEIGRLNEEAVQAQNELEQLRTQRDAVLARLDALDEFGRVVSAESAHLVTVTSIASDDIRTIYASASDPDGLSSPSQPFPDSPDRLGAGTADGEASTEVSGRCANCGDPIKPGTRSTATTGWTHSGAWQGIRCKHQLTGATPQAATDDTQPEEA
jgi:hypothetical protein